jgi:hypothetical protein
MGICRPEETGADDADEAVEAAAAAVVGMDTVAEAVMVGESESERRLKHLFGGWIESDGQTNWIKIITFVCLSHGHVGGRVAQ